MFPHNRRHMFMRMVFIMRVRMFMLQHFVGMHMRVVLGQVQPYATCHQNSGSQ